MTIDDLLTRRIIFIVGKGGVGKSTVAAALALTAARRGLRICIVECDGQEQMSRLFQSRPVGYTGTSLAPNVRGISITTEGALGEFVMRRLPLKHVSRHFINNRLVRYFLDATPGLKELLVLGKIVDLSQADSEDLIIVDMPATGHGMAMLSVPDIVVSAVQAGPLKNHAAEARAIINDPAISAACFVTLAEELAANETVEVYQHITETLSIAIGPVIANCVHVPPFDARLARSFAALKRRWLREPATAALIAGAELARARAELNRIYIDRITSAFGIKPLVVPFLFVETIDPDALAAISDILAAGGGP